MAAHAHEKCEMRKWRIIRRNKPWFAFFTIAAVNETMLGAIKLRELSSATRLEESQNKEILFFQDHDAWFNTIKFAETEVWDWICTYIADLNLQYMIHTHIYT